MAKNLQRSIVWFTTLLLFLLILITCLSVFLIIATALQINGLSYSLTKIININESEAKVNALADSFEPLSETIAFDYGNLSIIFDDLNTKLLSLSTKLDSDFLQKKEYPQTVRELFLINYDYVYSRDNEVLMLVANASEIISRLTLLIPGFTYHPSIDLEGVNRQLQEKLLPNRMTFLTRQNFKLESWFRYRSADRILGEDYLTLSPSNQIDYFPATPNVSAFTNVKFATFPAVNGFFHIEGPRSNTSNVPIHTQVTVPTGLSFTQNLSYFIVHAHTIGPRTYW